jgi:hypothetical protein
MFQNKSYEAINIENAGIMMKSTKKTQGSSTKSTKSTLVNIENAGIVENSLKKIKLKEKKRQNKF